MQGSADEEGEARKRERWRKASREYRARNQDKVRAARRKYRARNLERVRAANREYQRALYAKDREGVLETKRASYLRHRTQLLRQKRDHWQGLKLAALIAYSQDPPTCRTCGFTDVRALSIDHVEGSGTRHTQSLGGGQKIYHWLIKNGFPRGFQVLCMNCQFIRKASEQQWGLRSGRQGQPEDNRLNDAHNALRIRKRGRDAALRARKRLVCLVRYSQDPPTCIACGYRDLRALSLDHLRGGGRADRGQLGGTRFYDRLKREGFPDGFQVLCMNCQFIKRAEKGESGRRPNPSIPDPQGLTHSVTAGKL